jgi:hypothetical protein
MTASFNALGQPGMDIISSPAQKPGAGDDETRRNRRWVSMDVLSDGLRPAPQEGGKLLELENGLDF